MSAQFEGCPEWYVEMKQREALEQCRALQRMVEPPKGVQLTDERIDAIAETVIKGMPDGLNGFLKTWGWRQFARALLEDCAGYYREKKE
jgi:hypothetical protein